MVHLSPLNIARGISRLLSLALVCSAALFWVTLSSGQAALSESAYSFGRRLAAMANGSGGTVQELQLNGTRFRLLSLGFDEPLEGVMTRFEMGCVDEGSPDMERGSQEMASWFSALGGLGFNREGVFRAASDHEGVVACFASGFGGGMDELGRRLKRFIEDGDLAHFGGARYIYLRQNGPRTTAVLTWTEGSVILPSMFPSNSDAPGRDLPGLIRPAGSRRTLSAAVTGVPYEMVAYRLPEPWSSARFQGFLEEQKLAGWGVVPTAAQNVVLLHRDAAHVIARLSASDDQIALLQLASP